MLDTRNGLWIFTALLVTSSTLWHTVFCEDETVSTLRGQSIVLTCPIDITSCGDLHSVKWFKGNDRIAVVSGDGDVSNVEGQYSGRMTISHNPKGPLTKLNLKSVQVQDEDTYICETTFLEPMESCDNTGSYSIVVKVNVPPSSIQIIDESNNSIKNSTTLGPLREGHRFTSTCEVRGTRPSPLVGWYRAGKRLTDSVTSNESSGLFTVKSVLSLQLSRQELGAIIECRVETPALENVVSSQIHIDLQVRPTKVDLSGVKDHTVQGSNILLECLVVGARPAANVSWYNNTQLLDPDEDKDLRTITTSTDFKNDGTFETLSRLIFAATRFENGVQIRCEADNVVMRDDSDKPLHDTLSLEVMYPPVVTVKPENITVNETGEFLLFCEYEANPASLKSVRWLRNGELVDISQGRIDGGTTENTALSIKEASRDDIGLYTCELTNDYGKSVSENDIDVDVHYVPIVELTKDPKKPIIEKEESNVTLYCNVVKANPSTLLKVRWFLDGQMLKELPECQNGADDDDDSLCGVNPNVLLLENVGREFLGNYSCEGLNAAGWGQRSKENELMIYYQPGNATLIHHPQIATKKKSVIFQCSVEDGGNPNATRYRWLRGGSPVMDVVTSVYTVDPVGLDSRTNFSCYAYNEGGDGNLATIELDVHAPQAFIQKLHPYTGALYNTPAISLSCRVECVPECSINWFKDGVGIEESNDRYYVNETYLPAEPAVGDFESVLSVLHFNLSSWPDHKLDIYKDNANYSCSSTSKADGSPGVRSATYVGVEYPPENTTITNSTINVEEGLQPPRVSCSAKAYPEPYYEWRRKNITIAKGSVLNIFRNMTKEDDGDYECLSFNKHGNHSAVTRMNVLYKPNCTIDRKEINDEDTLICTAIGNPNEMDFEWSVKSDNETTGLQEVRSSDTGGYPASFLILNDDFTVQRTYRCVANNSVGVGTFCEIDVAGHLMWWQRLDKITLYILLGLVAALLLTVIIVCIIIICICRKRRRQNKYHTDLSISATQSVLSVPTTPPPRPPPPEIPKSPPKWPLRPGVMVHVKCDTKQNLCASRTQSPASIAQSPNSSSNQHNVSYASPILNQTLRSTNPPAADANNAGNREMAVDVNASTTKPPTLPARNLQDKSTTSATISENELLTRDGADTIDDINGTTLSNNNDELINFTSSSLIERILGRLRWRRERTKQNVAGGIDDDNILTKGNKRAVNLLRGATGWFGSGKSTNSSTGLFDKRHQFSGITCSDGVVTYKRTPVAVRPIVIQDAITNNNLTIESRKRKLNSNVNDKSSAAGDPLTDPGEYENLPFHGMQSAPNKFYKNANTTNSNVVRVAPRPKTNPSTYNYNLANSFPSQFSSNFYPSNSNYPNYPINGTSYTANNYPNDMLPPATVAGTGGSTLPFNPFLVKNVKCDRKSNAEKKFNSLKSIGIKKSPQFYSMRVNKCRRHNSFANEPQQLLIVNNNHSMPYLPQNSKLKNFDQPLYENLTDSIQIHESSMQNDNSFASVLDEFNCEPERNSIYRSDSGISNSSYECITPVPAPRTNQRKCQSAPVYMNLPNSSSHQKHKHGRGSGTSKGKSNCHGNGGYHQTKHNSKCKNNVSNGGAFYNYEPSQTNPFVTSSRRQILVPKELFPVNQSNHQQNINDVTNTQSSSSSSSSSRRPVKLPLRKHHSFHFQPSQTVAGAKQNKKHYKNNGPLVFKPFNENSAFKPITPVPKSPNKLTSNYSNNSLSAPRICGTSLKRHMSNVETFQGNRNEEQNFLTDDEDSTPSSSSASTTRGKRLHYADLAPLNCVQSKSCSSGSGSTASSAGVVSDHVTQVDDQTKMKNFKQNGGLPKRTTQYATLKFNEARYPTPSVEHSSTTSSSSTHYSSSTSSDEYFFESVERLRQLSIVSDDPSYL